MSSIQWRIRRGVLELDHVFHGFYHTQYDKLSKPLQKQFLDLLEIADPELLEWVIYRNPCPPEFSEVVAIIHMYIDA
jgi:succinate dehydrogenase flavin-adding protein (antitoxin of CptAB toxin-antitoxin module)